MRMDGIFCSLLFANSDAHHMERLLKKSNMMSLWNVGLTPSDKFYHGPSAVYFEAKWRRNYNKTKQILIFIHPNQSLYSRLSSAASFSYLTNKTDGSVAFMLCVCSASSWVQKPR